MSHVRPRAFHSFRISLVRIRPGALTLSHAVGLTRLPQLTQRRQVRWFRFTRFAKSIDNLWSSLLAVAFVADMEDGAKRSREFLDAAKELAAMREADADSGPTASLPEALQAIREQKATRSRPPT